MYRLGILDWVQLALRCNHSAEFLVF